MSRVDRWEVDLLDRNDRLKASGLQVSDGQLHWSIFKSVPGDGSVTLTQDPARPIDWLHDRLRITHIGKGEVRTPFGIWLLSMPGWERDGAVTRTTIALSDKTELLNSPIGEWVTVPAGTNVLDYVRGIAVARGGTVIAPECPWRSIETLATARTWDPTEETTWLQVANDLLGMIGYASLWADMHGNLRMDPYFPPANRPIAALYGERDTDLPMRPTWSDDAELFNLPTGVRFHVDGDEETAGFVGRADLPDDHPLSAAARGRDWLRVESGEATSQQVADLTAQRFLDESHQVLRSVSVEHPIDETAVNDVVWHRPTDLRASIVERDVTLAVGAVVTDRIRHIYSSDGSELPWLVS